MRWLLESPATQGIFWIAVAVSASILAMVILRIWRDRENRFDTAGDHLAKFEEMHREGTLNDHEFRTIKTAFYQTQGRLAPPGTDEKPASPPD